MLVNLINSKEEKIDFDSGFYFGKGLFETILILNKPIFLDEHINRINQGLEKLGIKKSISNEMLLEAMKGLKNCAVKLMVSDKNTILTKRDLNYTQEHYDKGFKVKLSQLKRDPNSHMVYLKSFNYMDNRIEKQLASKEGYDEVLFLNTESKLSEGSLSNVFLIMKDKIITPPIKCGLLNGIVRNFILKHLGEKYHITEEIINLDKVNEAKGMFLTNSLVGLMWINFFNGLTFNKNSVYEEIRTHYENFIRN